MADGGAPGRSDQDVEALLVRLDRLLEQVESLPEETRELALDAVAGLTEVYGTALARMMDLASAGEASAGNLAADELIGHLLVLHGLHPQPVEERVARALEEVRAATGSAVALGGIDEGVAHVQVTTGGCPSSGADLASSVRDIVLGAAPELADVDPAASRAAPEPVFIPADAIHVRGQR